MARKQEFFIADFGRDAGKVFVITEMSSEKAERWAIRALLALSSTGLRLPESSESAALASFASMGFESLSKLDWNTLEPLLNEMFECVKFQPQPNNPQISRPVQQGDDGDIEEIKTRIQLRKAIFNLHLDFLFAAAPQSTQ
jgi:hypothetical protein